MKNIKIAILLTGFVGFLLGVAHERGRHHIELTEKEAIVDSMRTTHQAELERLRLIVFTNRLLDLK